MPDENYYRVQRERERADMQKRLRAELERDRNARAKDTQRLLRESAAEQSASGYDASAAAESAKNLEALRYFDEALQRANAGDMDGAIRAMTFAATLAPSEATSDSLEMLKEWARTGSKTQAEAYIERVRTERAATAEAKAAAAKAKQEEEDRKARKQVLPTTLAIVGVICGVASCCAYNTISYYVYGTAGRPGPLASAKTALQAISSIGCWSAIGLLILAVIFGVRASRAS